MLDDLDSIMRGDWLQLLVNVHPSQQWWVGRVIEVNEWGVLMRCTMGESVARQHTQVHEVYTAWERIAEVNRFTPPAHWTAAGSADESLWRLPTKHDLLESEENDAPVD